MKKRFETFLSNWIMLKNNARKNLKLSGKVSNRDLKYQMDHWIITDYSLIYDHTIFEFKPPKIYQSLWYSSRDQIIVTMNDLIEYQRRHWKRPEQVDHTQFGHIIIIQNLIDHVLQVKLNCNELISTLALGKERKKILAGDYKRKTHF